MKIMTLKDKVILGFYDDIDEANELKTACCFESDDEEGYDEAIRRAIELAKEDGLWEEIKYLSPEDQLIEIQTQYPELFEY